MKRSIFYPLSGISLLLLAIGCANPASEAPAAEVSEPAAETAAEPAASEASEYALEGTIGFVGSKVTGSHEGGFESFEGTVSLADGTPEGSTVSVTIDTTSLWADNEKLTGHLKSDDFFGVEAHPTATFQSTEIVAAEDGTYTLTGNLDLHGVTKQISFPATIEVTEGGFVAQAEFSIKRFDFDIVYPGKTDDLIRDDVLIKLDLRSKVAGTGEEMAAEEEEATDAS